MLRCSAVILIFEAAVALGLEASQAADGVVVTEAPAILPEGWSHDSARSASPELDLLRQVLFSVKVSPDKLMSLKDIHARVSDPADPDYGNFPDLDAICEVIAPDEGDVRLVEEWLHKSGVSSSRLGCGKEILANFSVATASNVLRTTFGVYKHVTGLRAVRAGSYSLPANISAVVESLFGLHGLPQGATATANGELPPLPLVNQPLITPSVVEKLYGISGVTPLPRGDDTGLFKGARQAVFEQGSPFAPADLKQFFADFIVGPVSPEDSEVVAFYPNESAATVTVAEAKAFTPSQTNGFNEASFDIQGIMGIAKGVPTAFFNADPGLDFHLSMKLWAQTLISNKDRPLVNSASYGRPELEWIANGFGVNHMRNLETDFLILGSLGVSLIFSSGDAGSAYFQIENIACQNIGRSAVSSLFSTMRIDGKLMLQDPRPLSGQSPEDLDSQVRQFLGECCTSTLENFAAAWMVQSFRVGNETQLLCSIFAEVYSTSVDPTVVQSGGDVVTRALAMAPGWPASSPSVTAVGSTQFQHNQIGQPEQAVGESFGSGGGFSAVFSRPSYQQSAVNAYFAQPAVRATLPSSYLFDDNGRASPDVAVIGMNAAFVTAGERGGYSGTSVSAPLFAAMVSLANEARLGRGMKPLGFLNPLLYAPSARAAHNDITVGNDRFEQFPKSGTAHTKEGFECAPGWDPVTGLGTPQFQKLLSLALSVGVQGHEVDGTGNASLAEVEAHQQVNHDYMIALQTHVAKRTDSSGTIGREAARAGFEL